jgi:hypothetical protein
VKASCALVALVLIACGSASDANEPRWEPPATGGASSLDGSETATGGESTTVPPATGGAESTGGKQATGGKMATGGANATGGKAATGGARSTGGAGTGGTTAECRCCANDTGEMGPNGRKCGYDVDYLVTSNGDVICHVTDVQCTPKSP